MPTEGFHGLRVLALESRHAQEISRLIETYQGKPFSAPAMREVPLAENEASLQFARELMSGGVDLVVFLTGVGARALRKVIGEALPVDSFLTALRRVKVVARGPKPLSVLREWNVPVLFTAAEPCTWREVLRGLDELPGGIHAQRVVVQEYGASNPEFLAALRERGAIVHAFAVYQWALPADTQPLQKAIEGLRAGQFDVALFTTGVQATHLFQLAEASGQVEKLRAAFTNVVVASIGPSTSETLRNFGIHVDLQPEHPKMGMLVKEAAESAAALLAAKRPA
jgi:uroporphyrinogen-III synthase